MNVQTVTPTGVPHIKIPFKIQAAKRFFKTLNSFALVIFIFAISLSSHAFSLTRWMFDRTSVARSNLASIFCNSSVCILMKMRLTKYVSGMVSSKTEIPTKADLPSSWYRPTMARTIVRGHSGKTKCK